MFKKFWKRIEHFLTPLKSDGYNPTLEVTETEKRMSRMNYVVSPWMSGDSDENVHRRNAERIEIAKLAQDKDAVNKNLTAQHRLVVATLILALVAVISTVVAVLIALHTKPVTVIIKGTDVQKTIQTTN